LGLSVDFPVDFFSICEVSCVEEIYVVVRLGTISMCIFHLIFASTCDAADAAADAADCLEGSLRCYFQIAVASKFCFLALVVLVKKHRTACCFYHD